MNKIILVTAPDDVAYDAVRVLLVAPNKELENLISDSLKQLSNSPDVVLYVWNENDNLHWLFDKKQKSDLIIFNAESTKQEIVGYMAAQPKAYYFGNLKSLDIVTNRPIFGNDCLEIIKEIIATNEKTV